MLKETNEIDGLKKEVVDLRKTVGYLRSEIERLTEEIRKSTIVDSSALGQYSVFQNRENSLEGDASWERLVNLLQNTGQGLTASELADRWGKSRSRTSEVLNKLAEEGRLAKFRDGRSVKFRASDEE
jgi:Fic family protein